MNCSPFLNELIVEFLPHGLGYVVSVVDGAFTEWSKTDFTPIYTDKGRQYLKHDIVQGLDDTLGDLRTQMEIEMRSILLKVEDDILNNEVILVKVADTLATLDATASLGKVFKERQFTRPKMTKESIIAIHNGVSAFSPDDESDGV